MKDALLFVLLFVLSVFLLSCAPLMESLKDVEVKLKKPAAQLVTEVVAQSVGYELAEKFPKQASDFIKSVEALLEVENKILVTRAFPDWSEYILDAIKANLFISMNLEKLLDSVEIVEVDFDRPLDQYEAKASLIRKLLTDLVYGMKFYTESL